VIDSDPEILSGTPVFVGTRVPVQSLFDYCVVAGFDSLSCTGMKRTASARKSSSARGTSTSWRRPAAKRRRFAVCVQNKGYEASLERNKIYTVLPDEDAERDGDLRVIDESGEDYLFSADCFVAIEVPAPVRASLLKGSRV
jgi:hypothetical protein